MKKKLRRSHTRCRRKKTPPKSCSPPETRKKFVFPYADSSVNLAGKVIKSDHPTYLGEVPNAEKNTAVFFTEERTIQILQKENKMTWRPGATFGNCLASSLSTKTPRAKRKFGPMSPQISWRRQADKYVIWRSCKKVGSVTSGPSMVTWSCHARGPVSPSFSVSNEKNTSWIHLVWGQMDKGSGNIQAPMICGLKCALTCRSALKNKTAKTALGH